MDSLIGKAIAKVKRFGFEARTISKKQKQMKVVKLLGKLFVSIFIIILLFLPKIFLISIKLVTGFLNICCKTLEFFIKSIEDETIKK